MARRRLEAAIQAGKAIQKFKASTGPLASVEVQHAYSYHLDRNGVFSLQYSLNGQLLAVGHGDGAVQFLSSANGELHKQSQRCDGLKGMAVMCLRFNPVEHHLCYCGSADGKVRTCSSIDGTSSIIISEPGNEINCLDFRLDGANFATAGKDLNVRIYDTLTHKEITRYEGYSSIGGEPNQSGHSQRIFALRYHPDHNNVFVTGGWDNHLKIWDSRTESGTQRRIPGPHLCGDGLDIKNGQVLTGSWVQSNALQLWDYGEGTLIKNVPFPDTGHGEFLYCAQFGDTDVVLAGGSGTNSVQAISTRTGEERTREYLIEMYVADLPELSPQDVFGFRRLKATSASPAKPLAPATGCCQSLHQAACLV